MPAWISILLNWAGLAAFISSISALYIALKRLPMQDNVDKANTVEILQRMVDEKAQEMEKKAVEIKEQSKSYTVRILKLESDLAEVKSRKQAPFRIILEGETDPLPKVLKDEIEILPSINTVVTNQGNQ